MARKKPGQRQRVGNMVMQQLARKISTFKPTFIECPNEVEVDGKKRVCGNTFWHKVTLYEVFYVPQRECQRPGGTCSTQPHDHFECVKCGHILDPMAWKKLAKEAYEAGKENEKKIIVPEDIRPEDNGDDEDKPDAG